MIQPKPEGQIPYPISEKELERRWAAVGQVLKKRDLDILVVQNEGQDLGGYVRWLTDQAAGYPVTVIFPRNGEMTVVLSGDSQFPPKPRKGISSFICDGYFRTLRPTHDYDARIITEVIKKAGARKVGLVNLGRMHACTYKYLTENLEGVTFEDITDDIDLIKAIKSPEELKYIENTAKLHDTIMAAVPTMLRPGRMEYQVRNDLYYLSCEMGGEGQIVLLCGSAPKGQVINYGPLAVQNRRIQYGDQFMVMLESSGPGGFFCEMSRYWSIGEPDEELVKGWEAALGTQRLIADLLRPGADLREVFSEGNKYLVERGYYPEGRIFGHSQGYDLVERPGIQWDEVMPVAENMVFAVHPSAINDKSNVFCCDNYIVTKDGSRRLEKMPQEIIIL
ncbi:MAG: M24 family metallopeptidase [Oscillospiraceae bacterium]|jgi:Xaa-Pro aminopeptidase